MYLAARAWGIQPSEFWQMTISEILAEVMVRGDGKRYAGGLTAGDIEEMTEADAAFRAERAKARGTSTANS